MPKQKHLADGDDGTRCLTAEIAEHVRQEMQHDNQQMCECGERRCFWPACGTLGRNILE